MRFDWRCGMCGCTGGSDVRSDEGVYRGADIITTLHRSVSPDCKGGADTIRVTATSSTWRVSKSPQRGKKKAQASRA